MHDTINIEPIPQPQPAKKFEIIEIENINNKITKVEIEKFLDSSNFNLIYFNFYLF
jgi:hypothetical protein